MYIAHSTEVGGKRKKKDDSPKLIMSSNLPDALEHNCSSCSEAQKKIADRLSHHLIENKPEDWKLLEAKYDPSGAYRKRYLHERDDDATNTTDKDDTSKAT
ncbi:hypothetical protein QAD02_005262 [Eretmocerus hayati]|uniref:Uncharacterized protein n=1 Tax=Eretmocerus hayati TaxID=131215 RepID=A0ACC2NS11_9HYME|nr:hypothetical protein QAD02_005262 [Eretmocerus hayati]